MTDIDDGPRHTYKPSHPGLFAVEFAPGDCNSSLRAAQFSGVGEIITRLEGLTKGPKAYSTLQCGPGPEDHVHLNSDLLYVNHSCEPNLAFDLSSLDTSQWHVRALTDIKSGDSLTFFYPSTEWLMDQPFACQCGSSTCLGTVRGAATLSDAELARRGFVNRWIKEMRSGNEAGLPLPVEMKHAFRATAHRSLVIREH